MNDKIKRQITEPAYPACRQAGGQGRHRYQSADNPEKLRYGASSTARKAPEKLRIGTDSPRGKQTTDLKKQIRSLVSKKGFTLIELMVVVIILGILAALVVPKMVGREKEAKQKAAFIQIELLGTALDYFALHVGRYPTTSEGLTALVEKPSGVESWKGPYLKKIEIPRDPWLNEYHYVSPGKYGDYDLYSYGADNAEGGEGNDQDIVSWRGLKD